MLEGTRSGTWNSKMSRSNTRPRSGYHPISGHTVNEIVYSFSFSTNMSARSMPGVVLSIEEGAVKRAGAVCSQRI